MFPASTYINRRAALKKAVGSGVLLFLGNNDSPMNYAANAYPYRQDSTFLYYFGNDYAGLSAVIDVEADKEIIFGDELTMDDIIWMGSQPTIREKCEQVGIEETRPSADLACPICRARWPKGRRYIFYRPIARSIN